MKGGKKREGHEAGLEWRRKVQREGWCGSGWWLVEAFVVVGESSGGVGRIRLLEASCGGVWVRVRRHTLIAMRVGIPRPFCQTFVDEALAGSCLSLPDLFAVVDLSLRFVSRGGSWRG